MLGTLATFVGGGGSPGRLRRIALVAVAGALLAGAGGAAALQRQASAVDDARRASAHLVSVQDIRTALVRADADVTDAFLSGGLEPAPLRRRYADALATASAQLVRAARTDAAPPGAPTSPGDGAATSSGDGDGYADANRALGRYGELMEAARTTNRQGLPVGANYLRMGSRLLRAQVLPTLTDAAAADAAAADAAFRTADGAAHGLAACAVAGVGLLALAQVRLARLTRRVVAVPAAATGALLLVALVAAGVVAAVAGSRTAQVHRGAAATTDALAQARVAAFDAKALEGLTLAARGSTPGNEALWSAAMRTADRRAADADAALLPPLDAYAREHAAINALDVSGRWADGVRRAVSTSPGSAGASFAAFDVASAARLERSAAAAATGLADAHTPLPPAAALLAVVGLVAAGGAVLGVSRRLAEYR